MNAALDGGALPLCQLITTQEIDIVIDEDNRTMNSISGKLGLSLPFC